MLLNILNPKNTVQLFCDDEYNSLSLIQLGEMAERSKALAC